MARKGDHMSGYTIPPRMREPSGLSSPLRIIEKPRPEMEDIEPTEENVRRACVLAGWTPGQWPPKFSVWADSRGRR
jgi:hypothetical protein